MKFSSVKIGDKVLRDRRAEMLPDVTYRVTSVSAQRFKAEALGKRGCQRATFRKLDGRSVGGSFYYFVVPAATGE